MGEDDRRSPHHPGRPWKTSVNVAGYRPGVAEWVTALRTAIRESDRDLRSYHRDLLERGEKTISYAEMSRQLRDGRRYPTGPDARIVAVILDSCSTQQREKIAQGLEDLFCVSHS